MNLRLSVEADADLSAMLDYGGQTFGWDVADAYFLSFEDAFDLLRRHPLIGALHEDVRPPIHSLPHRSHRILYDVIEGEIIVQRVLHMAMDVRKHLAG